ncbi:MAG: hypothetical protein QXO01_01145 [Nitrososphaerota archaeon]
MQASSLALITWLALISLSIFTNTVPISSSAAASWDAPETGYSWGLGLIVPDGGSLENGSTVRWDKVNNVTVVVTLPKINQTDGTIYVILSAMTKSGNIVQVAAGLYPEENLWFVYSMYIAEVVSVEKSYVPISIKSGPTMKPGDAISMSIYSNNIGPSIVWMERVCNLNTGDCRVADMLNDGSAVFMPGEQEIIALESYTTTESVFEHMENMTLHNILLNGVQVTGRWYVGDGMVFDRSPLFQVGGIVHVPSYISMYFTPDGKAVWYYSPSWERWSDSLSDLNALIVFMVALLVSSISLAMIILKIFKIKIHVVKFSLKGKAPLSRGALL